MVLERVLKTFFKNGWSFSNFVRIDAPMYFLEVVSPRIPLKYSKSIIFTDLTKNYDDVTVVTSDQQYLDLIKELKINKGTTSPEFRKRMSQIAFSETAYYDTLISNYFNKISNTLFPQKKITRK